MLTSFILLAVTSYLIITIFRINLPKNFPPGKIEILNKVMKKYKMVILM